MKKFIRALENGDLLDGSELSKDNFIEIAKHLHSKGQNLTRRTFEDITGIPRSFIEKTFGTFTQFKSEAGIMPSRTERRIHSVTARHSANEKVKELSEERKSRGDKYKKPNNSRYKTCIIFTDVHDKMCDAFGLRVLVDTIKRVKPDNLICGGDLFDAPEFGRYFVDPREWDASGRIKFTHDKILKPIREAAPKAQFDLIEGNHDERILKHLVDNSPALMDILNSIHGMKISDIFALDRFQINYIAKGDLHTWTASESKKEVAKNNQIYYDSFIVSHYPQTRNKIGLPGVNGHHHKYMAYSMYNHTYGSYLWHQLGSLHVRDASYADGQPWNNGFMIAHVDTKTKQTNWEYINITDFAVVGGKYYTRKPGEFLIK